jgi:type I restriction enzyme S subunit
MTGQNVAFEVTTVGEVCDRFGGEVQTGPFGSQLHASDYSENGTPVVMPQDMKDGRVTTARVARVGAMHVERLKQHMLRRGDIALSRRGDVGRFAVITEEEDGWLCGTGSIRIRLNCPEVDTGYLRWYLSQPSVRVWLEHNATGVTMPNLNTTVVRNLPLAYPSLHEQRRIAAILDKAETLRAMRRKASAHIEGLAQSIFTEIFSDALSAPERITLGTLVDEFRYGTSNKSGPTGYPALRIPNIVGGSLDLADLKTVNVDAAELARLKLIDGDLLFVRTNGNPDYVGRCSVFSKSLVADTGFDVSAFIYASYLIRARLKDGRLLPRVLQYYLSTAEGRRELRSYSKTSAGQFNINTEGLGALRIPNFPMPLQREFIAKLEVIEKQRDAHCASGRELDALFSSLQQRAFHGEL